MNNKEYTVKFELNSRLDYYTIESVYQYIFNKENNNSKFPFIDSLFPKSALKPKAGEYAILDKIVKAKRKNTPGTIEYREEMIQLFKTGNYTIESLLEKIDNDYFNYFSSNKINRLKSNFNKEVVADYEVKSKSTSIRRKSKIKQNKENTEDQKRLFE